MRPLERAAPGARVRLILIILSIGAVTKIVEHNVDAKIECAADRYQIYARGAPLGQRRHKRIL